MNFTYETLHHFSMNLMFILFLLLIPFQDSGLSETAFGFMGLYLSNIPLILMFLLSLIYMFYRRCIYIPSLYAVLTAFAYMFLYSLMICWYVGTDITVSIYKTTVGCLALILQIYVFFISKNRMNLVKKYIWLSFIVNLIGWLLCDILNIDMGILVHRSFGDARFHGFASETSWFSFTTMILGILSIASAKSNVMRIFYFISMISVVLWGGSKGTLTCLVLAGLIYILFDRQIKFYVKPILLVLVTMFIAFIVQNFLLDSFTYDLSESTSFATRGASIIASIIIFFEYPFGTGYGAFQDILRLHYIEAFDILNSYIPIFALSYREIVGMIYDPKGVGLAIKGIFFQYIAYFGIPFLFVIAMGMKRLKNSLCVLNGYWKISCMFIVISLLTFAQMFYDSILFFAVITTMKDYYRS